MKLSNNHRIPKKINWTWTIVLILVCLLALVNFILGYRFYAVLMLLFCLSLLIVRRPNLMLIALPVLLVLLFNSQSLNAWVSLREANSTLSSEPKQEITDLFTPSSGMEVLPKEALQVQSLIDAYELTSYRLSEEMTQDQEVMQRVIESTWPVTVSQDSPYLFGFVGDMANHPDCELLEQHQDIELGYCY